MNLSILQFLAWLVFAGTAGGAFWHFRKPPETFEIPGEDPRLINRHKEVVVEEVDRSRYKNIERVQWSKIKPRPIFKPTQAKEPEAPFFLTRVINDTLVELMRLDDNSKTVYRIGDDIIVRKQLSRKRVGQVIELDRQNEREDRLTIEYENRRYILSLEREKQALFGPIRKNSNRRKYVNKNFNSLEAHEGRQVGANQFELNYEFFNAVIDNAALEGEKLNFSANAQGNYYVTSLDQDSVLRKFGFQEQDVLLGFNGKRIKKVSDIVSAYTDFITTRKSKAKIRVNRKGKPVDLDFTILSNKGEFKKFYE